MRVNSFEDLPVRHKIGFQESTPVLTFRFVRSGAGTGSLVMIKDLAFNKNVHPDATVREWVREKLREKEYIAVLQNNE
jgi:hypothetical protein